MSKKTKKKNNRIILKLMKYVFVLLFAGLGSVIFGLCLWASSTFNVNLNAIVNTMLGSLQGTSEDTIRPAVLSCLPWIIGALVIVILLAWIDFGKKVKEKYSTLFSVSVLVLAVFYLFSSVLFVQKKYDFIDYFKNRNGETSLYADRYINPLLVKPKTTQKRNLIYIYLESMENTYADKASGGAQEINYIPYLTKLAQNEISFSPKEGLGGFLATDGATWTMGALFSTTSGVPFEFPVGNNDMEKQETFASGIYTLGDFLKDEGYNQMFLCGSDGDFAGRKTYFEQHGDYTVYDLYMARKNGDIPKDYKVWWGYEDAKLFEIAKEQISQLASKQEPFNFTMLTADTHHIGGYVCQLCENEYEDETANVVRCTDRQLENFMEWLINQPFYENTTVVISGDHPRMDNHLVEGISYSDRLVYNCFVNSSVSAGSLNLNRQFTGMDMFPTTLAAMGYEIPGNRLGLGVNLFSEEQTLVEEYGYSNLEAELMKSSEYYIQHFAPELSYLIEDEFGSLQTIYFYGNDYNADQFISTPIAKAGIASWPIGKQMDVDIPVSHPDGDVVVKLHIQETYNGEQTIELVQNEEVCGEVTVKGNCVVELPVKVSAGHVLFSLRFPNAISGNELDETNPDTNQISLLLNSLTVNEIE